MNALQIVSQATSLNYFKTKSDKKRAVIRDELEQFFNIDSEVIGAALVAESARLLEERAAKEAAKLEKAEKRAAKIAAIAAKEAAKPLMSAQASKHGEVTYYPDGRYVLTVAQNNTLIDEEFFEALQAYCKDTGAQLLIAQCTYNKHAYKNARLALDAGESADVEEIYYAPEIAPYVTKGVVLLGGRVLFHADSNTSPTCAHPLTGWEQLTGAHGGVSVVVPASKIALHCMAAYKGAQENNLYSTGACTRANYIMRKAGNVASLSHAIGALVVEVKNGNYTARNIEQMDGALGFYDLGSHYSAQGIARGNRAAGYQFGDIHAENIRGEEWERALSNAAFYNPVHCYMHDTLDFKSRNHHNRDSSAFTFGVTAKGDTVRGDISQVAGTIEQVAQALPDTYIHIIESNHDCALQLWLDDSKQLALDPVNAITFLELNLARYKAIEQGESFNALEYAISEYCNITTSGKPVYFHVTDEQVLCAGIAQFHGHHGANGARGGHSKGFAKMGHPTSSGHTHSPSICNGSYVAGVVTKDADYAKGASNWRQASIVTWANGQRQVIFY